MIRRLPHFSKYAIFCCLLSTPISWAVDGRASETTPAEEPQYIRDALWVWANPEMGTPGEHTAASFASAGSADRARILGVPNVILAGNGLPHDRDLAARWSAEVADAPRLVWEIVPDGDDNNKENPATQFKQGFEFKQRIDDLTPLVKKHPRIEAVLIDDMTSVAATEGFKPEHLRNVKTLLKSHELPLKLWGVLYTMNFPLATTDPLIQELDVILLTVWHARDLVDLEMHVAECERRYPGKQIVLCLYMYDYGVLRRMPLDVHQKQCETALELLHQNRIEGIVFVSINDDEEVVTWTADWIKKVGGQKLEGPH